MAKFKASDTWFLLKTTFTNFMENNPFRLAGALAYNAIFSLPPILIIVITAAGVFLGKEAVSGQLYEQLDGLLGPKAAAEIQTMVQGTQTEKSGLLPTIIGIATLIFAATTFFVTLQESLNSIWDLKPRPDNGFLKTVKDRVLSFGLLISLGFLLLISLALSAGIAIFSGYLKEMLPDVGAVMLQILAGIISAAIVVAVFAMIYKFLPDAIIRWKDVLVGAAITALLFIIGKFCIGMYVSKTDVGSAYGAAGSIIILLVWIYYSSLILFFGAELTQTYANNFGGKIKPKPSAIKVVSTEVTEEESMREKTGRPPSEGRFKSNGSKA